MSQIAALQLEATFRAFVNIFRIFGLFPFYYNSVERRFYACNISLAYSVLYSAGYIYFFARIKWLIFVHLSSDQSQYNRFLITAALMTMYAGVVMTNLVAILYRRRFLRLFNGLMQLWYRIRVDANFKLDRKLLSSFLFKIFVVDLGCCVAISIYGISSGVAVSVPYDTMYHVFNFLVNATFTNLFVVVSYLGAHYYRLINVRISAAYRKIEEVSTKNVVRKRLVCSRLVRELHQLAQWHGVLNQLIHEFTDLHSASLAVMILKNFVIMVGALFGAYVCTVVEVLLGLAPVFNLFAFHMLMAFFFFMQFYYLVTSAAKLTRRVIEVIYL